MGMSASTSRLMVPAMIVVYGLFLFGVRVALLDGGDVNGDIVLASFTSIVAAVTWAIDMG